MRYGLLLFLLLACQMPDERGRVGAETWSLVGPAVHPELPESQSWEYDEPMNNSDGTWALEIYLEGGKEFKFRKGGKWADAGGNQLGGDLRTLTQEGANISVPQIGRYLVNLEPDKQRGSLRLQR